MTNTISAFPDPTPISITLSIYSSWPQISRIKFSLRNLNGSNEAEKVAHASQIMDQVANELHYLTHFGIDKGTIHVNSKKESETIYFDLAVHEEQCFFTHGVQIELLSPHTYVWVRGNGKAQHLMENVQKDGWQRQQVKAVSKKSFRLPCMVGNVQVQNDTHFFTYFAPTKKKRGKVSGWVCRYDSEDPVFNTFIDRFSSKSNLCVGRESYWAESGVRISGIRWKLPKFGKNKPKRKSHLASLPKDDTEYVYLIRMGSTSYYKIGKSNDPNGRLGSLQTGSPHKLKLLNSFKADNATSAEELLHNALHDYRKEGEWFKLSDEQQEIIASVQQFSNNEFQINDILRTIENMDLS